MAGRITMGTSTVIEPLSEIVEVERQECEWLLTSGILGRSNNLARVLRYICEEHFQGRDEHIKEYTIAVEALGRREAFDPQTDTIVRVTVHALRKRLQDIYQNEGARRPVKLVIPPGHYAPSFVHEGFKHSWQATESLDKLISVAEAEELSPAGGKVATGPQPNPGAARAWWSLAALPLVVLILLAAWFWGRERAKVHGTRSAASLVLPTPKPQKTIRALMGGVRPSYTDQSGKIWAAAKYCDGGTDVALPPQRIDGTEDAPLYLGGVRGMAHCVFPVTEGVYEAHFYFAETSDLPSATRVASLSINASPTFTVDVVDAAGGHNIATSTVVTGVSPENDGAIHVDFVSEVSLLNAVEFLPAPSNKLLPVRIVANSSPFIDDANQEWLSDRFFSGGRHGQPPRGGKLVNLGIYQSNRIGRFRYNIPAVPQARYRVRLFFREPWFGQENGGIGGPGSRIFDVACNGVLLLKNFDILAEGNSKPVVKTFDNVQANAAGQIELYFMPVVNYPMVNAIEVVPEP